MVKMLRRNVLVDLGPAVAGWDSKIIVPVDAYTTVNQIGNIVGIGGKCRLFTSNDIGRKVMIQAVQEGDRRFTPAQSLDFGLKPHWHVIAFEDKIVFAV